MIRAPRLLLLTSTLGSGHLRAAQAVAAAFRELSPAAEVQTLDLWSLLDDRVAGALRQAYLKLVQQRPELYERIYRLDERTLRSILDSKEAPPPALVEGMTFLAAAGVGKSLPRSDGGFRAPLDRLLFRWLCTAFRQPASGGFAIRARVGAALIDWGWHRLAQRLRARVRAFGPDVAVATQLYPAALLSFVKTRYGLDLPLLGVPTDYGMHDYWRQPGIDHYCVAHETIAAASAGTLAGARIAAGGIPLMPGFRDPPSQRAAREQLHLDGEIPVALVLGGGLGLGVDAVAARLLAGTARTHVLVVAGHNAQAQEPLARLAALYPGRLSARDWTEQMEVFMRAADVVIGKPGGLTTAEALACGRPLLATHSVRGQESFNLRFLERCGVGRLVAEDELPAAVESLLDRRDELVRVQDRAWSLGRRDGAARIAALALDCAQARTRRPAPPARIGWGRSIAQRCLRAVDALYHAQHRLQPVGEMLYVGRRRYRGPPMEFADGTRIAPGDFVGTLHFNNARFLQIEADSARRAASRFAPLMLDSLRNLAERVRREPPWSDLPVYHGVSWLGPHGRGIGFQTQPVPQGYGTRLRAAYFRLLVWAFAPAAQTRASARPEPTLYWLTRKQLLRRFGAARGDGDER
jgi:UDP-N-acetylglucosamine:LPS N-acetylglucosamine transferase